MTVLILDSLASIALAFGAWMGIWAFLKPSWIAKTVGLQAVEGHAEGYSEFRATYGGLFTFSHLSTLAAFHVLDPVASPIVLLPLAIGWMGAGSGRTLSILRDAGTNTRQNWIWVGFELGMGTLIGLPLFAMIL